MGDPSLEWGECVQYNHMFSDTEHNKIMNVRVYDKIMNEICSEFTNGKME
jgi:hypothetical protein